MIIKKIIIFISIRDSNINKYIFDEYVIIDIYFLKHKNNNLIIIKIIRETYLINDLKANIFINNDCIDLEKIVVNSANNITHIDNYNVIVIMNVKTSRIIMQMSVHARKIVIVFL